MKNLKESKEENPAGPWDEHVSQRWGRSRETQLFSQKCSKGHHSILKLYKCGTPMMEGLTRRSAG
eukprot:11944650-Prorocentrum_lima.AAC.1